MSAPELQESSSLHESLRAKLNLHTLASEVLDIWERRIRGEIGIAADLLQPALRNALPRFLELLSEAFAEKNSRGMDDEASSVVQKHAGDRARETNYSPAQIVQELQLLRDVVTQKLEGHARLSPHDYETIQKTFDQAIQEALMEFFLVHASLREQFTATLSHDLRNPLSVARMGAQLIQGYAKKISDRELAESIGQAANQIVRNLKRSDRMIQDLLDASVLEIGEKVPVHIEKCNLLEIAREAISELSETQVKRVKVVGATTTGYWDRDGLRRSIENLVTNAIKYGGEETPITVTVSSSRAKAQVSVHNEGNPIPENDLKILFRTYRRSKSAIASGQKGWGIGLALARAVAESLGGSISVESSAAKGTTFTIELPEDSRIFAVAEGPKH